MLREPRTVKLIIATRSSHGGEAYCANTFSSCGKMTQFHIPCAHW